MLPILFFFSLLFVLFSFKSSLVSLINSWQADEYSHGYIIPILAALIGWHKLTEAKPKANPSWGGLIVILLGYLLLVVSQLSAFEPPSHYGFILCLFGLSLTFYGKNVTKVLAPALLYLLFAVPLPRLIYVALSADLQLISSTLGVLPLQMIGLSVFQDGNIIDLGGYKLQVVEACNGLRYLFPLMSFGYLVALMLKDSMWKRIVLFLSTIPLTIIMNSLRIAVIGVTVNFWGDEMAKGLLHDFEGWTVFLICVAILMAEMWVLMRLGRKGHFRHEYLGLASGPLFEVTPAYKKPALGGFVLILVLMLVLATGQMDNREEIIPPHPPFALFPTSIGNWHGQQQSMTPEVLDTLKLNDYVLADYKNDQERTSVNLYMAYYGSQRVGSSIHSPSNCIPGGGWEVARRDIVSVPVGAQSIPVTRLLIHKEDASLLVYYWLDQRGRIINEQYGAKWYLLVDSIKMHRTDGALVRLTTSVGSNEPEEQAEKRLQNFLTLAYPEIRTMIPD